MAQGQRHHKSAKPQYRNPLVRSTPDNICSYSRDDWLFSEGYDAASGKMVSGILEGKAIHYIASPYTGTARVGWHRLARISLP